MSCACKPGFDATFVQLGEPELTHDVAAWKKELEVLRATGVRSIVLQYTGDEHGSYDARRPQITPVRALLDAAASKGIDVYLGLHADPNWPEHFDSARLPAPLDDASGRDHLRELSRHAACAGFYIPHEIDEQTWASAEGVPRMAAFLQQTSAALRGLSAEKPIAIAPFYAEQRSPAEYARFWQQVLQTRPVDIVMLQDGKGARGTPDAKVAELLRALRAVLDPLHIELWSVVEIFRQVSGSPVNDQEFAAVPAELDRVAASMSVERPLVRRMIAFSVLDYMHPARGEPHRRLYDAYRAACVE
jgi:hypothetical protein